MHYYQFNIGDYKSHTDHLDLLEDLAFRRMIDWCYLHESPLPLNINEIAKKILMRSHTESIAYVLSEFFEKTEEGYINNRIKKEVLAFNAKSEKARASAMARWNKKQSKSESNANASETQSEGNAKHKTLNTNQEPLNKDKLANHNLPYEIFSYWCEVMKKNPSKSKLTDKRNKNIKARLKDGYSVEDIKLAILNCSKDSFSMGQNDRAKEFNDIELICRSGEKLESFRDMKFISQQNDINAISTDFSAPEGFNRDFR